MSVAASRWALDFLAAEPPPWRGGLSCDARSVLLALAAHASHPHGIANVSAPTLGAIVGRNERTVRKLLDELDARSVVPVIRRTGCTPVYRFLPVALSPTPGIRARGELSPTPGAIEPNPGRARPTKGREGDVLTSTYAVQRGGDPPWVALNVSREQWIAALPPDEVTG